MESIHSLIKTSSKQPTVVKEVYTNCARSLQHSLLCPLSHVNSFRYLRQFPIYSCTGFNLSISSGTFPTNGNFPQIVPIPKSSDKGSPKNYCPISLLPILSKLLEKHVYGLLSKYLQLSDLMNQSMIHGLVSNKENQLLLLYWKTLAWEGRRSHLFRILFIHGWDIIVFISELLRDCCDFNTQ